MKILALNAVTKFYNADIALNHCTLEVNQGERLVILGPSGCGKTTVLRLIAGFIAPDLGNIWLDGVEVSKNNRIIVPPEKRNIGMVFQDLALWPHLSVYGNIAFGLKVRGVAKHIRGQRVREILKLVGMEGYEQRKPSELSGGQQQRVALARALVLQPKVLLMDEPLSSLDLELNMRLRKEVVRLQEELGFTLLYVTHDREEAFDIAHNIVLMKDGRIEFRGTVEQAKAALV